MLVCVVNAGFLCFSHKRKVWCLPSPFWKTSEPSETPRVFSKPYILDNFSRSNFGCKDLYAVTRSSTLFRSIQSLALCWNTVGTIVSPSLSHKAMLEKSFNQIDEEKRSQHYATLNRGRRGSCFNDLCQ